MAFNIDMDKEQGKCKDFLKNFHVIGEDGNRDYKYLSHLQLLSNRKSKSLKIALDDVYDYFEPIQDINFLLNIENDTKTYITLFSNAADILLPEPDPINTDWDFLDEFISQASERQKERISLFKNIHGNQEKGIERDVKNQIPDEMKRRYDVFIIPRKTMEILKIRNLGAKHAGNLIKIRGIVMSATDVRPRIKIATYVDVINGVDYYQEVLGRNYTPLLIPPKIDGKKGNYGKLEFLQAHSKYISFQEIKVQERADEVPMGSTPRTFLVNAIGDLTKLVKPGDYVKISGIYTAEPYTGFKGMRAGLLCSCYTDAMEIEIEKISFSDISIKQEDLEQIQKISENQDIYELLSKSIAPEIYGHEDVKKALLLMMIGGISQDTEDKGLKLRGDIHMCLMGDPGVAKSQLLKFISNVAPRAVYTTGKGSSGVGLTAAVVYDDTTKEPCLEGGALVLADRGICCIDEFDKMDESDRTTIHEVMEQQTVSIAKAGITTSLNARTSVLAAANPFWGKYNAKQSPSENIHLPPALLSRFDLMWLILDKPDKERDGKLADHVLHVHQEGQAGENGSESTYLTHNQIRTYISVAKSFKPILPENLHSYLANKYVLIRQENLDKSQAHTYATPRTLLSVVRLAQASAKLYFRKYIEKSDIDEALRLMKMSKITLEDKESNVERLDPISSVYRVIQEYWSGNGNLKDSGISMSKIHELCKNLNITKKTDAINACIKEYSNMGLMYVEYDNRGQKIIFFADDI